MDGTRNAATPGQRELEWLDKHFLWAGYLPTEITGFVKGFISALNGLGLGREHTLTPEPPRQPRNQSSKTAMGLSFKNARTWRIHKACGGLGGHLECKVLQSAG
jgi:hypothetical protein